MAKKKASKKAAANKAPAKAPAAKKAAYVLSDLDQKTIGVIARTATAVHAKIQQEILPELKFPVRSLSNVNYEKSTGYFELGKGRKARALTVNTVKSFAQTLRLMSLSKEMVENDNFATKREAYYISKNWNDAKFNEQPESDTVMDDIEALASLEGLTREQLRYRPEEHGGALAGELIVIDRDRTTGNEIRIDCTAMGTGAYTIPSSVEHLRFETKAKFILAIETGGMFHRLNDHQYWRTANCILISMGGVPSRAQRRFMRRLSDEQKLPIYCFVDCDPYGIANIYRTLKVGSGNAAHINRFFCVPKAQFLGVTPQDILDFQLEDATHPLKAVDIKRAKDALKNDPFFKAHPAWKKALDQLLKMGVRAEQQALAKWGLNFVLEEYLPRKLANKKNFLP
ncbi:MAG: DNA topoisomerase IV subunit A [Planctomycetes bacterium]|nr:DNA topoisomerase IV subunit A [Planctomycetota bacterium]MCB9911123.1 DNA topoisomerase IV subunit A [Planctomycetota bacterium]MCB9912144.1 DNA topoisomerase IV subunit A [Planctomycetota bacterium]